MVRVAGLWELGWNTPIKESDLWEFPLREYNVDRWFMSPVSGILNARVEERESLDQLLVEQRNEGYTVVFVDEKGETLLHEFEHPENALYVAGRTSYSPLLAQHREGDLSVRIQTPRQSGMLWAHQAVLLVLQHREDQCPSL